MPRLANQQQQQQQKAGTMAHNYKTTRRPDGINSSIVLHAITAMPQFENKSFEELRLEDYKAGNKGQNLQTVASGCTLVATSNNDNDAMGCVMMVQDEKPTSTEKQYGNIIFFLGKTRHRKKCVERNTSVNRQRRRSLSSFKRHVGGILITLRRSKGYDLQRAPKYCQQPTKSFD